MSLFEWTDKYSSDTQKSRPPDARKGGGTNLSVRGVWDGVWGGGGTRQKCSHLNLDHSHDEESFWRDEQQLHFGLFVSK